MSQGRNKVDPRLKRVKCNNFRLPQWIIDIISEKSKQYGESGGKLIERAIKTYFRLREPHEEKKKDRKV